MRNVCSELSILLMETPHEDLSATTAYLYMGRTAEHIRAKRVQTSGLCPLCAVHLEHSSSIFVWNLSSTCFSYRKSNWQFVSENLGKSDERGESEKCCHCMHIRKRTTIYNMEYPCRVTRTGVNKLTVLQNSERMSLIQPTDFYETTRVLKVRHLKVLRRHLK